MLVPVETVGPGGPVRLGTLARWVNAAATDALPLNGSVVTVLTMLTADVPLGGAMPVQGWLGTAAEL